MTYEAKVGSALSGQKASERRVSRNADFVGRHIRSKYVAILEVLF